MYFFFQLDTRSKANALKVQTIIFTLVIVAVVLYFLLDKDQYPCPTSRLLWMETAINFVLMPFGILLILGIKKDNLKWVNVWLKVKILQATCIFPLNIVILAYLITNITFGDEVAFFIYAILVEVFYCQNIIFLYKYYLSQTVESRECPQIKNLHMIPNPNCKF